MKILHKYNVLVIYSKLLHVKVVNEPYRYQNDKLTIIIFKYIIKTYLDPLMIAVYRKFHEELAKVDYVSEILVTCMQ
jgi:hypothetical protein